MASRLSGWTVTGDADAAEARTAGAIDTALSFVAAFLVWPFPVMRQVVSAPVHAVLLLVALFVAGLVYRMACLHFWGRTAGMYFKDLGFDPRPSLGQALAWSVVAAALSPLAVFSEGLSDPAGSPQAKASGLTTVSAR